MKNIFLGFILGLVFQAVVNLDVTKFWYAQGDTHWKRGDKLVMSDGVSDQARHFYRGCDITFLAAQATSNSNRVWVLLQNCSSPALTGQSITDDWDRRALVRTK